MNDESFFENVKNVQIYEFLENFSWRCGQTVVPERSILTGQRLMKNARIEMRHYRWFSNNVLLIF